MYAAKIVFLICAFSVLIGESNGFFLFEFLSGLEHVVHQTINQLVSKVVTNLKKAASLIPIIGTHFVVKENEKEESKAEDDDKDFGGLLSGEVGNESAIQTTDGEALSGFVHEVNSKGEFVSLLDKCFGEQQNAENQLVVAYFYASSCEACTRMGPKIEQLANKDKKTIFVKVDIDILFNLADVYEVVSTPTLKFIKNKEVVETIEGSNSKNIMKAFEKHRS